MKKTYILFLIILLSFSAFSQDLIGTISGTSTTERLGSALSLSDDGSIIAISSAGWASFTGRVRVFQRTGNTWTAMGNPFSGNDTSDFWGRALSVSSDGTRVALGSGFAGTSTTFDIVKIYDWDGTNWIQVGSDLQGDTFNDTFGYSLDISSDGNTIVIGTLGGNAKVFNWDGTNWNQLGSTILEAATGSSFGENVSIASNGNRILVTASEDNTAFEDAGSARVYDYNGTDWIQIGSTIFGSNTDFLLGRDASMTSNGETIAMASQAGVVVYEWNTSTMDWQMKGSSLFPGTNKTAISDTGNLVLHSSIIANFGDGEAEVSEFGATGWTTISTFGMDDNDNGTNNREGSALGVSVDGTIIAIGSEGKGSRRGEVKLYDMSLLLNVEETSTLAMKIYPNPTTGILDIKSPLKIDTIKIYNLLGRQVAAYTKGDLTNNQIDLSKLSNGLYLMELSSGDKKQVFKISKK